jgi:inosine-uridine nucleoside N-ribohydrolase
VLVSRSILRLTFSGVDDVLAMLLALAASPEEIEVMMISVTYGNVEVQRYCAHVVSLPVPA